MLAGFFLFGADAQIKKPTTSVPSGGENTPSPKPKAISLHVSETEVYFAAKGGVKTLTVRTNASSWSVSAESSWCPAKKSGTSLILNCAANISSSLRDDYFYVNAGGKQVRVSIRQQAKQESISLSLSTTEVVFEAGGGTETVNVYTNAASWSTPVGVASWITKTHYSTYISLSASANTSTDERTDYFNVQAGDEIIRVNIKQKGKSSSTNENNIKFSLLSDGWYIKLKEAIINNPSYSYSDGSKYKGQMTGTTFSGLGAVFFAGSGSIYVGSWSNDKRHGQGIYIVNKDDYHISNCPNCKFYTGRWEEGLKSGYGTCYGPNGVFIDYGTYTNDYPSSSYTPDGYEESSYRFKTINYDSGNKYIGETKDGQRHGLGIFLWGNGGLWFGGWQDGIRDGYGIYIDYNGSITTGSWDGDTYSP
jgi:hypothetical protein